MVPRYCPGNRPLTRSNPAPGQDKRHAYDPSVSDRESTAPPATTEQCSGNSAKHPKRDTKQQPPTGQSTKQKRQNGPAHGARAAGSHCAERESRSNQGQQHKKISSKDSEQIPIIRLELSYGADRDPGRGLQKKTLSQNILVYLSIQMKK